MSLRMRFLKIFPFFTKNRYGNCGIKKLKQKNPNGCGQTCVAMISDLTEEKICDLLGKKDETTHIELINVLYHLGFSADLIRLAGTANELPINGIILLKDKTKKDWGHWIVVRNGNIFDPYIDDGPLPFSLYAKRYINEPKYYNSALMVDKL